MAFDRRELLKGGAALSKPAVFPRIARAQSAFDPRPGPWRAFQIVTRLEVAKPQGTPRARITGHVQAGAPSLVVEA